MSWDIVLFHSSQKINDPAEVDETKLISADFCEILEANFKDVKKNGRHRTISQDGYSIDFFYDDPASNIMLSLYGENAIYPIIDLSIKYNWQIFDSGIRQMIDLNNPANNGYQNFQNYLSQLLNS